MIFPPLLCHEGDKFSRMCHLSVQIPKEENPIGPIINGQEVLAGAELPRGSLS